MWQLSLSYKLPCKSGFFLWLFATKPNVKITDCLKHIIYERHEKQVMGKGPLKLHVNQRYMYWVKVLEFLQNFVKLFQLSAK